METKTHMELAVDLFRCGYDVGRSDALHMSMDSTDAFREVMAAWDTQRKAWINEKGSDDGFADWFTAQVVKIQRRPE